MRSLLALLIVLGCSAVARAAPPNVVCIIGDDQGAMDYGFLGHPHIRTPNGQA